MHAGLRIHQAAAHHRARLLAPIALDREHIARRYYHLDAFSLELGRGAYLAPRGVGTLWVVLAAPALDPLRRVGAMHRLRVLRHKAIRNDVLFVNIVHVFQR